MCQLKHYLSYTLGLPDRPHNLKADLGNAVHKSLELLARKKLAEQNGWTTFTEGEIDKEWKVKTFTVENAIDEAWAYIQAKTPHWEWTESELRKIRKLTNVALDTNDGMFSPLKRTIIQPEQFFDITFDQPWAQYSYDLPDGKKLEGQLSIRGTVDLICEGDGPNTIEYIDWKSGAWRKDWSTGKDKDWTALRDDPQLRIYHYAISKLYPNVSSIMMTIFYLQAGGPFSLPFSSDDLLITEMILRHRFEEIKNSTRPTRIKPNFKCSWCWYEKEKMNGESGPNICDAVYNQLTTLGIDKVTNKYRNHDAANKYEGGGRSNDTLKVPG